jgi:hypothetical protein
VKANGAVKRAAKATGTTKTSRTAATRAVGGKRRKAG